MARHSQRSVRSARFILVAMLNLGIAGRNLPFYTQDSTVFYNDVALYASNGGVVLSPQESGRIVEAMGQNKAVIMQGHGIMTVGGCVESAVAWFMM
jgi:ribulose-5-phosphate 4-epimerase/fuculose-1-phosphate aldolase